MPSFPLSFLKYLFSRRRLIVLIFLLFILALSYAYEYYRSRLIESDWQTISSDLERKVGHSIQSKFKSYCDETFRSVEKTARSGLLTAILENYADTLRIKIFEYISSRPDDEVSLEVYDRQKRLVAWHGNRGTEIDTHMLTISGSAVIHKGAIYSYFAVYVPLFDSGSQVGYLVGKRLFDVNYPLNNRFINDRSFTATFPAYAGIEKGYSFIVDIGVSKDHNYILLPLYYLSNEPLVYVSYKKQTLVGTVEAISDRMKAARSIIYLALISFFIYAFFRYGKQSRLTGIVPVTIATWLIRYALVALGIPSDQFNIGLFGPQYFASTFGFGVAKSMGDLFLSSVFLAFNLIFISWKISANHVNYSSRLIEIFSRSIFISIPVIFISCIIHLLMIRGYAAVVRSAVFDSALFNTSPENILPAPELFLMLVSLLLISISFLIGLLITVLFLRVLVFSIVRQNISNLGNWIIVSVLLASGGIIFGVTQENSLLSQTVRLAIILSVILFTSWLTRVRDINAAAGGIRGVTAIYFAAVLFLVPLLTDAVRRYDRSGIEILAAEILRPENSWLDFLLNRSLDEFTGTDVGQIISGGSTGDKTKLAFTQWAKSILSEEGNNCSIAYYDEFGRKISVFHVGMIPSMEPETLMIPEKRLTFTEEMAPKKLSALLYGGTERINDQSGALIGAVRIDIMGSRQAMMRGETPDILRRSSKVFPVAYSRELILSEYYNGKMGATTGEDIPIGRSLPERVAGEKMKSGIWIDDEIDGKMYETFFFRGLESTDDEAWFALSRASSGLSGFIYSCLWYIFIFIVLFALLLLIFSLCRTTLVKSHVIGFKTKLTAAFALLSLFPIILIAFYNRQHAFESTNKAAVDRLREQTSVVAANIEKKVGTIIPVTLARMTDDDCREIADELDTDFNLYYLYEVQASSKPEMFESELIDSSLSSDAYVNIFLKKKRYFWERRLISSITYIVGYRPISLEDGAVIGVVAVPTLFRQVETDEALARRNMYLYAAYEITLLLSVLIGTIFANRISLPVSRLKDAVNKIAKGDMDIRLPVGRMDEFGDLEKAFQNMTQDLKSAQAEMVKAERESVWKEVAKQVAHEIKNPLTPMKLSVQHLRQSYKDKAGNFADILNRVTSTVLEQIEVLSRIASEFSRLARMPVKKIETVDLHEIIVEAKTLFEQYKSVHFSFDFKSNDPTIRGDREELRRALINVLRNSVQALKESGNISIATNNIGSNVEIIISDEGPGIPDEIRRHLFEPNFSTKTDGMGLGLSIVRNTVESYGGSIIIESGMGKGTNVIVRFPLPAAGDPKSGDLK